VLRFDCDDNYTVDSLSSTTPSVEVQLGTAGEAFVKIQIRAAGENVTDLAEWPYISYQDSTSNGFFLRGGGSPQPTRGIHRQDSYFIPAAANAGGAQGTYWTTALTVFNLDGSPRTVEAYFTPRGSDGTTDFLHESLDLGMWSSHTWEDVVGSVFGSSGVGSLEVRGRDIIVSSRTSTPGAAGGSYGQGIPSVAPYHLIRLDDTTEQWAGGGVRSSAYRTNLGLCEVWGESAEIRVSLWNPDLSAAGSTTINLAPYGNTQINDLPLTVGAIDQWENGRVQLRILSGAGRVAAYLSIVDNVTGDATYIPIGYSPPSTGE
jgi:hypothetical protein